MTPQDHEPSSGGAVGGATGLAAGADDLRTRFARFQQEAKALHPKLEQEIQAQAGHVNVQQLLGRRG